MEHEMRKEINKFKDFLNENSEEKLNSELSKDTSSSISDVSDSKLYTRSEVIKLIQDFYIDKNKWDYNNDQPNKLNIDYMNNEVEKWMENK